VFAPGLVKNSHEILCLNAAYWTWEKEGVNNGNITQDYMKSSYEKNKTGRGFARWKETNLGKKGDCIITKLRGKGRLITGGEGERL